MSIVDKFMWVRIFLELLCLHVVLFCLTVWVVEELKVIDGETELCPISDLK